MSALKYFAYIYFTSKYYLMPLNKALINL